MKGRNVRLIAVELTITFQWRFRYMKIHIFALRWKDEIRRSSQLRTLLKLVVVSRTWKNFRPVRGFNPWPLRYRCSFVFAFLWMLYIPTYTFCGRSVKWGHILACSSQGRFKLGSEEMNNIARVNIFVVWETSAQLCDEPFFVYEQFYI